MKKILIALLAMTFLVAFASCDDNDTSSTESSKVSTTSVVSEEESLAVSEESSEVSLEESSEESSEDAASPVVDGVFMGEGYSFTMPEGFQYEITQEGISLLADENHSIIATSIVAVETPVTEYTQADFETEFANYIENCEITGFEAGTIDDINAVAVSYTETVDGAVQTILQYVVLDTDVHYTIAFGITTNNLNEIVTAVMPTFVVD